MNASVPSPPEPPGIPSSPAVPPSPGVSSSLGVALGHRSGDSIRKKLTWQSEAKEVRGGGWQQEHIDMFAELRKGNIPNEAEYGAKSTMTAIMGRMATYGGKIVKWDDCLNSEIALADFDSITSFDAVPPVLPDTNLNYPVAVPGETRVI